MRRISYLVSVLTVLVSAKGALAQTDLERATARDAANSGRAAFDAGQYERAIDSFSRAESLVHAPPHLLFMARAQAKLGRLVAARETYLKITRETLSPKAPKAFVTAQDTAESELSELEGRLPSVTVTLKGAPADGVVVQMDDTTLPPAMIGIPLPADPGKHVFTTSGTATGDPVTISLAEGAKQSITLKLRARRTPAPPPTAAPAAPAPAPAAAAVPAPLPSAAQPATPVATPSTTPTEAASSGQRLAVDEPRGRGVSALRVASYVSLAIGAVGLGVGGYYMYQAKKTDDQAGVLFDKCNALSPSGECGPLRAEYEAKNSDAGSQRTIGTATLIGGGVGVVAGVIFLLLDAGGSERSAAGSSPRVTPVLGFRSVGVVGTF